VANVTASASSVSQSTETPSNTNLPPYTVGPTTLKANLANGSAADQVQQQYIATLSLAGAAQTIDLTSLTDPLGVAVNFTAIKRLRVRHKGTTDGQNLTMKPGTTNGWTALLNSAGTLAICPATGNNPAWVEFVAPNTTAWAVSSTSKTITFDPGANTYGVDLEIYGI